MGENGRPGRPVANRAPGLPGTPGEKGPHGEDGIPVSIFLKIFLSQLVEYVAESSVKALN